MLEWKTSLGNKKATLYFAIPHRVPLKKGKSIREAMKEEGVLEDYLKDHNHEPVRKYLSDEYNVTFEPMSYMDVRLLIVLVSLPV